MHGHSAHPADLLKTVLKILPAAVYVCDADGLIVYYNRWAAQAWQREPRINDPREGICGSMRLYSTDGVPIPHEMSPMAEALATGRAIRDREVVVERPDGSRIVALVNIAPLKDASGRLLGAVNVFLDITARKEAEQNRQASEQRLREQAAELRALSRRLLEVQEAERRHLARELHDEIGQTLTALKLSLSSLALVRLAGVETTRLREAAAQIDELIGKVSQLSLDLGSPTLDVMGLLAALEENIDRYTAQTGVAVTFEHRGLERRFSPAVETAAYRIVQEALTNVARHAGVREAAVRVRAEGHELQLEIADRGAGFATPLAGGATSGLTGMRERAILAGGRLKVESVPGGGTRVLAELPLPP